MRLLVWNVHFLAGELLAKVIKAQPYDLIGLEEISKEAVAKLKTLLPNYQVFRSGGNCLLSLHPLTPQSISLCVGESTRFRTAILAEVQGFKIIHTHLDHTTEEIRLRQLKILEPHLAQTDLIMGDLNSLYRGDYSEGDWVNLNAIRLKVKLEPACSEVMNRLVELGFRLGPYLGPTTPYDTRVDYIATRGMIGKYFYRTSKLSDHHPVLFISEPLDDFWYLRGRGKLTIPGPNYTRHLSWENDNLIREDHYPNGSWSRTVYQPEAKLWKRGYQAHYGDYQEHQDHLELMLSEEQIKKILTS